MRVGRLVGRFERAHVDNRGDARVGFEVGLDFVLVPDAGILEDSVLVLSEEGDRG